MLGRVRNYEKIKRCALIAILAIGVVSPIGDGSSSLGIGGTAHAGIIMDWVDGLSNAVSRLFGGEGRPSRSYHFPKLSGCADLDGGVDGYSEKLRQQRKRYIDNQKDILAKCAEGIFSGPPCRAANSAIDAVTERIDNLSKDCKRIVQIARAGGCGDDELNDLACHNVPEFCDTVHSAAQSFIGKYENSMSTFWDKFSSNASACMQQMYQSQDDIEPVVTMP